MDKLSKMQKIADARGNPMSRFHNALYAGDVVGRITILREVGLRKPFFKLCFTIPKCLSRSYAPHQTHWHT